MKTNIKGDFQICITVPWKGRPVIVGPNSPTQRLSSLLQKMLALLLPKLKSYIKDDSDFFNKLSTNWNPNCTFFTSNIDSLCTNILHELGLRALVCCITKYRNIIPIRFIKEFILEAAELLNLCWTILFY